MTIVRLGYVAMSTKLQNASPSQTMTFTNFQKNIDRDAAIQKLERIALSNLDNIHRLLKHNAMHDIHFFRLTSKIIPLANHEQLAGWNYMRPLKEKLFEIGKYVREKGMRIDFHPDHFVVLNSPKTDVVKNSIETLKTHYLLLKYMNIDPTHRCVLHVGGRYQDTEQSLERFIENWMDVPKSIQQMIILENDDKSFTLEDTLYLCEKLGIPLVFDVHHHLAHHQHLDWAIHWDRVVNTWSNSPLSIKMHISSPKSESQFRHHSDYVDIDMFFEFLQTIHGTVPEIHCMIEAKQKDGALFQLMEEIKVRDDVEIIDGSSFYLK